VGLADRSGKTLFGIRYCYEVHMVGHQAVRPDLDFLLPAPCGHHSQIRLVVGCAEEDRLAPVPTLDDMVGHLRRNHSRYSRHARAYATPSESQR